MADQAGLSCGVVEGLLGRLVYNVESGGKVAALHAPPGGFSQVFILNVLKVACFHTLLQVFILKGLRDCCFLRQRPDADPQTKMRLLDWQASRWKVRDEPLTECHYTRLVIAEQRKIVRASNSSRRGSTKRLASSRSDCSFAEAEDAPTEGEESRDWRQEEKGNADPIEPGKSIV